MQTAYDDLPCSWRGISSRFRLQEGILQTAEYGVGRTGPGPVHCGSPGWIWLDLPKGDGWNAPPTDHKAPDVSSSCAIR